MSICRSKIETQKKGSLRDIKKKEIILVPHKGYQRIFRHEEKIKNKVGRYRIPGLLKSNFDFRESISGSKLQEVV